MKKNYIVKSFFLFLLVFVLNACKEKNDHLSAEHSGVHQEYTCPMHPQIIQDKPGTCPICGMDLVPRHIPGTETDIDSGLAHLLKPANEQVVSTISTVRPVYTSKIISTNAQGTITYDTRSQVSIASRVAGRIERLLIKYNYQPVKKGQLIMEIYAPDLAAAQRELLMIFQTGEDSELLGRAKQRLRLLGMQEVQINKVLKTGAILYRIPVYSPASGYILEKSAAGNSNPNNSATTMNSALATESDMGMGSPASSSGSENTAGSTSPVLLRAGQYVQAGQSLFTIYNQNNLVAEFSLDASMASRIKKGQKLLFYKTADQEQFFQGTIGLIQPTFNAGSSFTSVRVYLQNKNLEIGQLVTADIPILSRGWWVPQAAVLSLGNKSVVFKKNKDVFVPVEINLKMTAGGLALVDDEIGDWEIASNAAYLVDSESFIKTASKNQTKKLENE